MQLRESFQEILWDWDTGIREWHGIKWRRQSVFWCCEDLRLGDICREHPRLWHCCWTTEACRSRGIKSSSFGQEDYVGTRKTWWAVLPATQSVTSFPSLLFLCRYICLWQFLHTHPCAGSALMIPRWPLCRSLGCSPCVVPYSPLLCLAHCNCLNLLGFSALSPSLGETAGLVLSSLSCNLHILPGLLFPFFQGGLLSPAGQCLVVTIVFIHFLVFSA